MNISIIDIGTKSLKHYVFSLESADKELLNYKRYSEANLGAENNISPETEERLFVIIKQCLVINQTLGVKILKIVGTEIFRSSVSAQQLAIRIEELTKTKLEILNQEKEAFYLYNGFTGLVDNNIIFAAVNIGGGSTEIVVGDNLNLQYSQKLPFGVNFLKNNFGGEKMDWVSLDKYLDNNISCHIDKVKEIFITGVLDFLRTVAPSLESNFIKESINGHPLSLSLEDYRALVMKLRETPIDILRGLYSKDPDFANNVAIGQSVYLKTAEKMGAQIVIPSDNDLTDGIIQEIK